MLCAVSAVSLYKARGMPTKSPVCAICVDRTRGRTHRVEFGYGVAVWLCEVHASTEFMTRRSGRDLVATLQQLWRAHGCLTAARSKALQAHLAALRGRSTRPLPGSYAWPTVRRRAEHAFAGGQPSQTVITHILGAAYGDATAPSLRTIRRWRSQRRWLSRPPP
jgi:hypothetical protein